MNQHNTPIQPSWQDSNQDHEPPLDENLFRAKHGNLPRAWKRRRFWLGFDDVKTLFTDFPVEIDDSPTEETIDELPGKLFHLMQAITAALNEQDCNQSTELILAAEHNNFQVLNVLRKAMAALHSGEGHSQAMPPPAVLRADDFPLEVFPVHLVELGAADGDQHHKSEQKSCSVGGNSLKSHLNNAPSVAVASKLKAYEAA